MYEFVKESEELSRSMLHIADASVIPKVLKVP